jgi:hypothetical protein
MKKENRQRRKYKQTRQSFKGFSKKVQQGLLSNVELILRPSETISMTEEPRDEERWQILIDSLAHDLGGENTIRSAHRLMSAGIRSKLVVILLISNYSFSKVSEVSVRCPFVPSSSFCFFHPDTVLIFG